MGKKELKFMTPPGKIDPQEYVAVLTELTARPNEWAQIEVFETGAVAGVARGRLKNGTFSLPADSISSEWDFTVRNSALYVLYSPVDVEGDDEPSTEEPA